MSQIQNLDPYAPTAEMPVMSEYMSRMLRVLNSPHGTYEDLWFEIYTMAQEDMKSLDNRHIPTIDPPKILLHLGRDKTQMIMDDYESDDSQMLQLLRSIPVRKLVALIDNSFGYQYKTDPTFKELCFEPDECAGAYLNTFVADNGNGLTQRQYRDLKDMMSRYLNGENRPITSQSSTLDKKAAEEAKRIDLKFAGVADSDAREARKRARAGKRRLAQPVSEGATGRDFCDLLEKRIRPDLDPQGDIQQHQSPQQVGCSYFLRNTPTAYVPKGHMGSVPKIWAPTLSCLAMLNIDFQLVQVPILKIWERDQLEAAEVLVTVLAGSMVLQGGMNPVPPRNRPAPLDLDVSVEKRQVFEEGSTVWDNVEHSIDRAGHRLRSLEILGAATTQFKEADLDLERPGKAIMEETMKQLEETDDRIKEAIDKTRRNTASMEDACDNLAEAAGTLQSYLNFDENVRRWLSGETIEDVSTSAGDGI